MLNPFKQLQLIKADITESPSGDILVAKLPVAGKKMFAHQ